MTALRPRVLVTRPEPGATRTVRALETLGFEPLKLPLQETRSLAVDVDAIPAGAAATAIPSASAIRHAPRGLIARLEDLPCFAVGAATAKVARQAGFRDVREAAGDAESMAGMVIAARPAGTVVYLCGKVRRSVFEDRLARAGLPVATVETYDTTALSHDTETAARALGHAPVGHALVYSANAAELLAQLMKKEGIGVLLRDTTLVCISARVAETFPQSGHKILVAAEPSGEALLNALQDSVKSPS